MHGEMLLEPLRHANQASVPEHRRGTTPEGVPRSTRLDNSGLILQPLNSPRTGAFLCAGQTVSEVADLPEWRAHPRAGF